MCIICVDWEKGHLTSKEAFNAVGEVLGVTEDEKIIEHLLDLSNKILDKDLPSVVVDEELEEAYWKEMHSDEET